MISSYPTRGPKVAHLTTVDLSLRYLVLPQLLGIRDLGGEAIGISSPGPYVHELTSLGIRHIALSSSSRRMDLVADFRAVRELWHVLRRERPHILHTHNPKPGLYGRVVGRLAGVPIVVNTVHGLYATPEDKWPKRVLVYALEAAASRFSHLELIQSAEDHALLTRWRITPPSRTRFLGNGVDLSRYQPGRFSGSARDQIRKELGANEDTIVVGMIGRMVAEKGYPEFFEMATHLDRSFLVVCAGPDDPDKVDALSADLMAAARETNVQFLGMRTDVDRLYAAMDIFVLPSHREGFPRAAMEATAMGVPVVATDIRGCREVVGDGVTGVLVPVGDVDALTAAVERLGRDPALRRSMSAAAILRAAERFDERKVVATVLGAYARLTAEKGVPWPHDPTGSFVVREADRDDSSAVSRLHTEGIATGFLVALGPRFLRLLYRALIEWDDSVVVVADQGGVVGFAAGVIDTGSFYRHFVRRYWFSAVATTARRLWRPSVLRKALQTLRYGSRGRRAAELLSIAVDPSFRGRGVGQALCDVLLHRLASQETANVRVVVAADNHRAISLYESTGFVRAGELEIHPGQISVELLWSLQE